MALTLSNSVCGTARSGIFIPITSHLKRDAKLFFRVMDESYFGRTLKSFHEGLHFGFVVVNAASAGPILDRPICQSTFL